LSTALPDPPPGQAADLDFLKLLYQAQLEDEASRRAAEQTSELAVEAALNQAVHNARLDVAKAAIDRGHRGAEFVRNAAAGIVTLYTGILGVTFATTEDATPLPARGLAPAVLLGLALVFASAYAAMLPRTPEAPAPAPHSQLAIFQERRLNAFMAWVSTIAFARIYFLHASVISLGWGVLLLPAPFIDIANGVVVVIGFVALAVTLLVPLWTAHRQPPANAGR
jgi:hypothetical protein